MYKKAGIIVGILFFVLAIGIFIIVSVVSKGGDEKPNSLPSTTSAVVQTTRQQRPIPSTVAPVVTTTQATTTIAQNTVVSDTTISEPQDVETTSTPQASETPKVEESQQPVQNADSLVLIGADTLPPHTDTTDIGRVVGRNVYARNGQVLFSLLINTTIHGQIEYFTTLTNYNIADGTTLNCNLRVYTTNNGTTYPSIISIST